VWFSIECLRGWDKCPTPDLGGNRDSVLWISDTAVHCAAALRIGGSQTVATSGDRRLLDAWERLGLATLDVTR
jgi:hypothetical protein